jgi:predicted ATPase
VLMIFEDVHWSDPTSVDALGRSVDRLRTLAVLLIITYRPEFEPPGLEGPTSPYSVSIDSVSAKSMH